MTHRAQTAYLLQRVYRALISNIANTQANTLVDFPLRSCPKNLVIQRRAEELAPNYKQHSDLVRLCLSACCGGMYSTSIVR